MLRDALGRTVPLSGPPRRIVSLVPSLTEYLCSIGAGELLVAVTDFCLAPAEQVARLPKVRGTKNPDRAAITALAPDLVLAAREENRQRDVLALEAAGIPVYVTDICSVAGALQQLRELARLLDAGPTAAPLLDELAAALEQVRLRRRGRAPRPCLTFIWRDPWMAIGADTYANDLLSLCGAQNLALQLPGRYPRAELEAFLRLDPQVILLPDEPYRFSAADLAAFAPFATVPAVRDQRVLLCDGALLTWYGPRTAEALRTLPGLMA